MELIRRTKFNAFDGERICASLFKRRELWTAVLLDRPGVPNYNKPGKLLTAGLIKLRDLEEDFWNADTLYILTPTRADAEALAKMADEEDWGGEVRVYDDEEEMNFALGMWRQEFGLISIWWD